MSATLQPIGILKKYIQGKDEVKIEIGTSVLDILITNGIPSDLVAGVIVNGNYKYKDYIVEDNDVIQVISVIGGG